MNYVIFDYSILKSRIIITLAGVHVCFSYFLADLFLRIDQELACLSVRMFMPMPMMNIRIMRMAMRQGFIGMQMRVRLGPIPGEIVLVLMVGVVQVRMGMRQGFVDMKMRVPLGDMQPQTERH